MLTQAPRIVTCSRFRCPVFAVTQALLQDWPQRSWQRVMPQQGPGFTAHIARDPRRLAVICDPKQKVTRRHHAADLLLRRANRNV